MAETSTPRHDPAAPTTDRVNGARRTMPGGGDAPPTNQANGNGGGLTRVTVNLTRPAVKALESVSEATGYSKTDTINRALQVYAIVQELMSKSDGSLHVTHPTGETETVHIL